MVFGWMLEYLFDIDKDVYDVIIFNVEFWVNYNWLMLFLVLFGEKIYEDIIIYGDDWYVEYGVMLYKLVCVFGVDWFVKMVMFENGIIVFYDKLVIVMGLNLFIILFLGKDLNGVLIYCDFDDVEKMLEVVNCGGCVIVIGGGFFGFEVVVGLKMQGMDVIVFYLMLILMECQFDLVVGFLLEEEFKWCGIEVCIKVNSYEIVDDGVGNVKVICFDDGMEIEVSIVVMVVGICLLVDLVKLIGLDVNCGILVNDDMCMFDLDIYVFGECVEYGG